MKCLICEKDFEEQDLILPVHIARIPKVSREFIDYQYLRPYYYVHLNCLSR